MGKIIALIMLVALIATPIAHAVLFVVAHQAGVRSAAQGHRREHAGGGARFESAWPAPLHGVHRTKWRDHAADGNQEPGRSPEVLAGAGSRAGHPLHRGQQAGAEFEGRQSAARRGSAIQRLARRHRHHLNGRRRGSAAAVGFRRRLSALHQPRRIGDGAVDAVGFLERSGRARRQ